jgi:hypothetical protein
MKLYRAKVSEIAREVLETLQQGEDIEVLGDNQAEAEQDLIAVMEEFLRREYELRDKIREHMADQRIPYNEFGRTKKRLADESGHPLGDDIERFLARQFVESMMISKFVDEVFTDDNVMYKKVLGVLGNHNVDEREIRDEAMEKVKNIREGTIEYEIALQNAVKEVKKRRGLIR